MTMASNTRSWVVGDRVVAVGVDFPATGVVLEVHDGGRYLVEWQTDYLTELVDASEIAPEPAE